jgi:xanthosine phosphorylase
MILQTINDFPFQAAELLRARKPGFTPRVALILGSGLGILADQIEGAVTVKYTDLPGFPPSGVHGHAGELVMGMLAGVPVVCMKGRAHVYEGHGLSVMTNAVRTMKLLGCEMLFVTAASGSLKEEVGPGSLVALSDHINLLQSTPMTGPNDDRFGPRFFSMGNAYDKELRALLVNAGKEKGIAITEGVYVAYPGPNFETAAEIRMMQIIGGDAVGMSIVPDVVPARHCGLKVVGLSVITNLAEGMSPFALSHEQTLKYAAIGATDMVTAILGFLKALPAASN